MMQVFFICPDGYLPIRTAMQGLRDVRTHGWMDTDAGVTQIVGVAEVDGRGNGEQVASALEAAGIFVLPDHRFGETLANHPNVVTALAPYGVTATDTTATAMAKVWTKSGFPAHKIRRFQ